MKPILFNTEMVKAILAGEKTMTRRIIKSQPKEQLKCVIQHSTSGKSCWMEDNADQLSKDFKFHKAYEVGDILWVRETWAIHDLMLKPRKLSTSNQEWFYKKKFEPEMAPHVVYLADYSKGAWPGAWKPSIHMPRVAARLFLKVKDIRVERLMDITEENARAEGIEWTNEGPLHAHYLNHDLNASMNFKTSKEAFSSLWDSIYAKRGNGWDVNPWVWVIEFERVEGDQIAK